MTAPLSDADERAVQLMVGRTPISRSYYRNSLAEWRSNLLKQRRQLMSRYATMERMSHPDKRDQGYLLEINEEMLGLVDRALAPLRDRAPYVTPHKEP